MMGHVMGQWFDQYMGATPSCTHRRRDKIVRSEEIVKTAEVAQPLNLAPPVLVVEMSRGGPVELIRRNGLREFKGSKEDDSVVTDN
ncbi:hypothetical protein GOBAR_DD05695 [Gossypium barbadense]|nr:hypothetical protein GOBAR_DD05695 [Gossypium barbadense]